MVRLLSDLFLDRRPSSVCSWSMLPCLVILKVIGGCCCFNEGRKSTQVDDLDLSSSSSPNEKGAKRAIEGDASRQRLLTCIRQHFRRRGNRYGSREQIRESRSRQHQQDLNKGVRMWEKMTAKNALASSSLFTFLDPRRREKDIQTTNEMGTTNRIFKHMI